MGSGVVEELCRAGIGADIGDIRVEAAARIAESLKGAGKVDVVKVDVSKREELVKIARKYEVVVNTIGPFYKHGYRVASALVEAGVSFVDICDDYDAAENILDLSASAEERGVVGVTGLGWTPGISNLLARNAYEEIGGDAEAVDIWWFGSAADSKGLAVVMHLFYALTGDVPMYLGGRLTKVKAGSSPAYTEFPHIGRLKLYYAGHPEPLTIPRSIRVLDRVTLRGCLVPQWQNGLARLFIRLGLTSTRDRIERLAKILHKIEDVFRAGGRPLSGVRVDVIKDNRRITYLTIDRMRRLTSIPASLGAIMVLNREIRTPGVHPPEKIVNPTVFLQRLGDKGVEITRY
jgi:saccharopine dehydrogenase-like NADP-dependent oxidoreductase